MSIHRTHASSVRRLLRLANACTSVQREAIARGSQIAQPDAVSHSASGDRFAESSEFRVEKSRAEATLTLSNGATVRGCFFVAGGSRTHDGRERVGDVLNGETGFVPFEVAGPHGSRSSTMLFNRDHIVMVQLAGGNEAHAEPGYDIATTRIVTMLLSNGARLHGTVRVYRPKGSDRLSDFTRTGEAFRYLEAKSATYLINVRHLLELSEETP